MQGSVIRLAVAVAVAVAVAGCAGDGPQRPSVRSVPFVAGGRVTVSAEDCDKGANAYCALDLVFVDRHFRSSQALAVGERRWLRHSGWIRVSAQTGDELAADSPRDQLRVTYASDTLDLKDIDLGWIKRPRPIALALSRAIYDGSPAISVNVVAGPS